MKLVISAIFITLTGCAAVQPKAINIGAEHLSSIEQHFGSNATNIGIEAVTLSARWEPTSRTFIDIQDAYIVNSATFAGEGKEYFTARVGFAIWKK